MQELDMARSGILYEDEDHKFIWLGWAEGYEEGIVQTNQYLIVNKNRGILLDPGGVHLFSKVVAEVSRYIDLDKIDTIIFSHQDPDVSSGIALWLGITSADIYLSELWTRFVPHFGIVDLKKIIGVPDEGLSLTLASGKKLNILPAHFLHSTGNFSVYDETSEILFSGDIGAAVFPPQDRYPVVKDFDHHLSIMEPFHVRYMTSNKACKKWVQRVRKNPVKMIAPQHGAIFEGNDVGRFLNWFERLQCGIDNI